MESIETAPYTRKILEDQTFIIPATTGTKVIAQDGQGICSLIDPTYTIWGLDRIPTPIPTESQLVEVRELMQIGTFTEIFRSMWPEIAPLALTQDQILTFVERDGSRCVPPRGEGLFTLFGHRGKFYVARFDHGRYQKYRTFVYQLDDPSIWDTPRGLAPRRFLVAICR